MRRLYCLSVVVSCLLLASCRPSPQYQQHYTIPSYKWDAAFQPSFTFDISDTAAAYQLFLTVRHTEDYPFSNIWLLMSAKAPGDSIARTNRIEVPLAQSSGQWNGRGMGEIWEEQLPISTKESPTFFRRKGAYTIRLTQDMRRNPLPEIMQIGLRIEKLGVPQQTSPAAPDAQKRAGERS